MYVVTCVMFVKWMATREVSVSKGIVLLLSASFLVLFPNLWGLITGHQSQCERVESECLDVN